MKNKTSLFLCLAMLFTVSGCDPLPNLPNSSMIDSVSEDTESSSFISSSSEPKTVSIRLPYEELTMANRDTKTIQFSVTNYGHKACQLDNSNSHICGAILDNDVRTITVNAFEEGTAVLTITAGTVTADLTINIVTREVHFQEHEYSLHIFNSIKIPFIKNCDYNYLTVDVFDESVSDSGAYATLNLGDDTIRVECGRPCDFKVRISSYEGTQYETSDVADFHFYFTEWPEGTAELEDHLYIINNEIGERADPCVTMSFVSRGYMNIIKYTVYFGESYLGGEAYQYGEKDGKYYFISPVFDFEEGPGEQNERFMVVDFSTMEIWAQLGSLEHKAYLFGTDFAPYHIVPAKFTEDIEFTGGTYRVGETIEFNATPTTGGVDFLPLYNITDQFGHQTDYFHKLDVFKSSGYFIAAGTYIVSCHDQISGKVKSATFTIVNE